jgi:ankyrin repeat protein
MVKLLLEKGAELESKDEYGRTPLSWAARNKHEAMVKLLLEKGAELESKDDCGRTPLSWAAGNGHDAMVKLLLEKGAELEPKDQFGQTPLLLAAGNGHMAVVKILLAKDALDPDSKDKFGRTPLSWAARRGNSDVVKLLLENYEKNGIVIRGVNVDIATPPAADHPSRILCDICMFSIPNIDIHHHCGICDGGDFDVCQECIASGAFCLDQSHKLFRRTVKNATLVEVPD